MMASLKSWWLARSIREQRMIAAMLVLAAGVALWLGVVLPVSDAQVRARADHVAALERNAAVKSGVALLKSVRGPAAAPSGALDQLIAASAAEAGFTLDSNMAAGADTTAITIGTARAAALLAWLDRIEQQGIGIEALQIQPAANGAVSARVTFKVRKP